MPLPVLQLVPQSTAYAVDYGKQAVVTQLDGGASRFRADQQGMAALIECEWLISPANFDYFMAFYRTATNYGASPFTISLILDTHALTAYTAHFIPGSVKLTSQEGQVFTVRATLEVIPIPPTTAQDNTTIAAGPQ